MLQPFEPGGREAWLAAFRQAVEIRPRYCETDQVGHVSNTSYGLYFEQARLAYARAARIDEPRGRLSLDHVAAEITMRFVAPCYYDEALRVLTRCVRLGRSSLELEQAIVGPDGTLRTVSRTAAVSYDFDADRSRPWSEAQRAGVRALEGREIEEAS
ncbi:MAG TPA: acyl-CoA thioesterase [Candidatus Dormibacteraeota bacterium]|nr:acyl-CoA thioesterase [Candidatus Dormibacteraeota bacterium]